MTLDATPPDTAPPPAAPASLHQRIIADIQERILSGEWPPGHRLPFEQELMARYGCSRMTVSKALGRLADIGIIERRRRAGSFVTQPHAQSVVLEIQDLAAEVAALGLAHRHQVMACSKRRSTRADRQVLDLASPSPILDLTCCHFAGLRPFCLEERIISLAAVPQAPEADFTQALPGTWLLAQVPWSTAEHRIRAQAADAATAAALKIGENTACLVIERRTWNAGQIITFVRLTYPGSEHELVARFSPSLR